MGTPELLFCRLAQVEIQVANVELSGGHAIQCLDLLNHALDGQILVEEKGMIVAQDVGY